MFLAVCLSFVAGVVAATVYWTSKVGYLERRLRAADQQERRSRIIQSELEYELEMAQSSVDEWRM